MSNPITVLISFYNNQHFLDKLLDSILLSDYQNWIHEIIVIDSASDSPPLLPSNLACTVKSIYNPLGSLTTSLNLGMTQVESEWACVLDCDTEIVDSQFWSIIDHLVLNKVAIAIPQSYSSNDAIAESFDFVDTVLLGYVFSKKLISPFLSAYYRRKTLMAKSHSPFPVNYFWNQCVFVHMRLQSCFRYNERLYVWACDFELSKRLAKSGESIFCFPQFKIRHHGEGSGKHDSPKRILGVLKGEFTYISISYPFLRFPIHALSIASRAARLLVRAVIDRGSTKYQLERSLLYSQVHLLFAKHSDQVWLK